MASGSPRLRVVGPGEPARRSRPGPAVLAVAAYALLFGGALWLLRPRPASRAEGPARTPAQTSTAGRPALSRAALLAGAGLTLVAHDEYFRLLSNECCSCGCDLNVRDCLLTDQACSRSPEAAAKLVEQLR